MSSLSLFLFHTASPEWSPSAGNESLSPSTNGVNEKNKQVVGEKTLPMLRPPPSTELPRSASVSGVVPRPRPLGAVQVQYIHMNVVQ